MARSQFSLGKVICGWQHHISKLDTFARTCEADSSETISLTLTDDRYIGVACLAIGGSYNRLDSATFKRWADACPWKCTFEPDHRGSPCLMVHTVHPKEQTFDINQLSVRALQISGVLVLLWLTSTWVDQQTPPEFFPLLAHELACWFHKAIADQFAQQTMI